MPPAWGGHITVEGLEATPSVVPNYKIVQFGRALPSQVGCLLSSCGEFSHSPLLISLKRGASFVLVSALRAKEMVSYSPRLRPYSNRTFLNSRRTSQICLQNRIDRQKTINS